MQCVTDPHGSAVSDTACVRLLQDADVFIRWQVRRVGPDLGGVRLFTSFYYSYFFRVILFVKKILSF